MPHTFDKMRPYQFFRAIGLTPAVRWWLRENEGDPLRESIVVGLMDAFHSDNLEHHVQTMRYLLLQLHRRIDLTVI